MQKERLYAMAHYLLLVFFLLNKISKFRNDFWNELED